MELNLTMRKLIHVINVVSIIALIGLGYFWAIPKVKAQCTGVFPANTLCGNLSGSPAPPAAFSAGTSVFGPGSTTVGDIAVWGNTAGTSLFDSSGFGGPVTVANSLNITPGGTKQTSALVITPPNNTMSYGLWEVWQNGTGGGSSIGDCPITSYNCIAVTDVTSQNVPGALGAELLLVGTAWNPGSTLIQKNGITTEALVLGTPSGTGLSEIVGLSSTARNATLCTSCENFGANIIAQADANAKTLIGTEFDIKNSATVQQLFGVTVGGNGASGTLGQDVAFSAQAASGYVGWDYGFSWTPSAIKNTGKILGAPAATPTSAGFGVDFSNVQFATSGFAFRSSGYTIDPNGTIATSKNIATTTSVNATGDILGANAIITTQMSAPLVNAATNINTALYKVGGVNGVSCSAGTVSIATFVVTAGIVTHC